MIFYVYSKTDGSYLYRDSGYIDGALIDMGDDKDYTLTPPPDYEKVWRWIDSKWTTDDTAN